MFTYRGSWAAEGANTSWDASWRLIGTKGTVLWDGQHGFAAHVVAGTDGFLRPLEAFEVPQAPDPVKTSGHASVIADFIDCIETGRQPETVATDNIQSLAMVFAAVESARTGARVPVST
jgi:predicted dehydrogenase